MLNKKNKKQQSLFDELLLAFIILYSITIVWVIVFKCNYNLGLHISANKAKTILERLEFRAIPFYYAYIDIFVRHSRMELITFLGNIGVFVPFGAILCYFTKKRNVILYSFLFSLAVEVYQLFSCWGGFEPTDLITNTFGGCLGILIYVLILKRMTNDSINRCALVCCSLLVPLDVFFIINSIINFPGF